MIAFRLQQLYIRISINISINNGSYLDGLYTNFNFLIDTPIQKEIIKQCLKRKLSGLRNKALDMVQITRFLKCSETAVNLVSADYIRLISRSPLTSTLSFKRNFNTLSDQ